MATILIVEDEFLIAAEIERVLRRLGHLPLEPVTTSDEALEVLAREAVELVLMDINIDGDTDGIATAILVRRQFAVPVVFLTAQSDPATLSRAKLAHPYGYILKPFTDDTLRTQLELALFSANSAAERALVRPLVQPADEPASAELPPGPARFFFVKKGTGYVKLRVEDILYLEALENYVRIFTSQGQYVVYSSLKELEARLPDPPFFRVHRSHVVNLDQAQGYEEGCVLFGRQDVVPVSRSCKEALRRRLNIL
ncbi:MAG: LytTR family transcriptional regulator DNA-binding domain-containing protein [Hymenobacteraceae bacterium]|nr:LytTR family transcriptional regulator DNA-binding domain-containing protein [Hymenobacteraceae bacterium]